MTALVRIEFRKFWSTPAAAAVAALTVALTAASVLAGILLAGRAGAPAVGTTANAAKTLSVGALSSMVMLVLGILAMAGEYRHRTILSAFLAEPRRGRVLAAKLVTMAVLGTAAGALTYGLALAIAVPMYAARGVHHIPLDITTLWWGTALAGGCYALLGVALGALTRNTVGAIVGAMVWVLVVELGVLQSAVPSAARWLPTGAAVAITGSADPVPGMLSPLAAAAVLVGWAAVLAGIAVVVSLRRELR